MNGQDVGGRGLATAAIIVGFALTAVVWAAAVAIAVSIVHQSGTAPA